MQANYHLSQPFETFVISDRAGHRHSYTVNYHDPKRAIRLCLRMAQAGGLALSRVLEANLGLIVTSLLSGGIEALDVDEVKKRLAGAIGAAVKGDGIKLDSPTLLKDLFEVLLSCDDEGLLMEVFSMTTRDGMHLSEEENFNHVYRANYGELRTAFIKIFQANGFADFLSGGLSGEQAQAPQQPPTLESPSSPSGESLST